MMRRAAGVLARAEFGALTAAMPASARDGARLASRAAQFATCSPGAAPRPHWLLPASEILRRAPISASPARTITSSAAAANVSARQQSALSRLVTQAQAVAISRPSDTTAQLNYLAMLYRMDRYDELLAHAGSGRIRQNKQIRDLVDAASAKVTRGSAEVSSDKGFVPPPQANTMSAPSIAGAGMNGYPPPGGPGYGGYPGGYGGPPPGSYPPPYGYGGGYGGGGGYPGGYPPPPPPPPPSSSSSSSSSSAPSSSSSNNWGGAGGRGYDRDDDDDGNDERDDRRRGRLGSDGNPMRVVQVTRFGFAEFMRLLLTGVIWVAGIGVVLFLVQGWVGASGGKGGGIGDLLRGEAVEAAEVPETRFADAVGVDEAKEELRDVVEYLQNPKKFSDIGAHIPKGVLLSGPPGTGKTLLARAVAGEAGVKFFARSASEFEEMLVGLGAKRVRDMFEKAKKEAPAIIFIDEIDAMGAKRGRVSVGSGSERQTLNQLLACMDGFAKNDNVVVIAATNNPEILDGALTRPGRFDSRVEVPLPDIRGRKKIIELYLSRVPASKDVDPALLAAATPGMSGAAIATLINSAAISAAKAGRKTITVDDLEEARDKTWMGPAMRSRRRTLVEMELTAYHEGGHTLAGLLTPASQELHKVTILPRGPAGGVTFFLEDDNAMTTREQLMARLDVAMGGRVAEELIYGKDKVTTGASSDMQNASRVARAYVKRFSMGAHALATYSDEDGGPSEAVKERIDAEVESLLSQSYERVKKLLATNKDKLERLAQALLEHETLTAEECRSVAILGNKLPANEELAALRRQVALREARSRAARIAEEDAAVKQVQNRARGGDGSSGGAGSGGGGAGSTESGIWGAVFGGAAEAKEARAEPEAAAEPEPRAPPAEGDGKKTRRRWV